ncbi:Y-family DNA polymerase [Roseovarius ramblicola]|uniref:DNA-directed DNA polymerase n=1 Tax=Roseovarius ramblicola TaxID=2022336 RepID=A0ABV5HZG5_9RHOB
MPARRILSVWFPRLGAERLTRRAGAAGPFAVVAEDGPRQVLSALSAAAEAAGLVPGQPLREAQAMCPDLRSAAQEPAAEAAFLRALARWADRFSPLVACDGAAGLMLDITGCAHLFGGEAALGAAVVDEAAGLGLSARCAIADTPGAAWALARFAGHGAAPGRSGDAIEQEARATRARAARRGPGQGRAAPGARAPLTIAPPGHVHTVLGPLPVAALRLPEGLADDLGRLGLRRIGDLAGQPRAALGRRFGPVLMRRLDQALGAVPEPLSASAPPQPLAARLSLPEPIGLMDDLREGAARLLARLCARLSERGEGARALRFEARGTDGGMQAVDLRLARPMRDADAMLALLATRLERIDAGFGIDMLRLNALQTERIVAEQMRGAGQATARGDALADLLTRLGARVGLDAITRRHPAESRIPGKTALILAAAWSGPAAAPWPRPDHPRPLMLWRPEPVTPQAGGRPCAAFRWRGRRHETAHAIGPERIAPEWWLDDPEWRTGLRDYWQVLTTRGERLWLFQAHGAALSGGWFCHGRFA